MTGQIDYQTLSDESLFEQFRTQRDFTAFTELVRRHLPALLRFLRARLHSFHDAEDLGQTTFFHIYSRADQFQPGRRFRPWLFSIADHLRIDWLRRERLRRYVSLETTLPRDDSQAVLRSLLSEPDAGSTPEEKPSEARERLAVALDQLPEPLRETIDLVYVRGAKYEEAARVLGVPIGTVKSRIHAAIERLKKSLASTDNSSPCR